jgi:hypothetical protein
MAERTRYLGSGTEADTQVDTSPAYTLLFPFGTLKNKSPAMVLLDDPANKAELLKQKEFFQKKLSEYPNNQKYIDAIDDAITLLNEGALNQEDATQVKSGMQVIYAVKHKYMSDTNAKGHRLFYGMTIECYYGNKYPWVITIENTFAPGKKTLKNGLTPVLEEKSEHAKSIIRLNDMEWSQLIERVDSNIRNFETLWYGKMYKASLDIDKANREARAPTQTETPAATNIETPAAAA